MVGAWGRVYGTEKVSLQAVWWAARGSAGARAGQNRKPRGSYRCTPIRENAMGLTPDQWENVKELFEAALERPVAEQTSFVANACPDPAVQNEVQRLLKAA